MSNLQIFITHTPNSNNKFIEGECITNVMAGAVYHKGETSFVRDDTGNNISEKNKSFCELTTQYWAWKNTDYDYYGFCHYRRLFSFSPFHLTESNFGVIEYPYLNKQAIEEIHFDDKAISELVPKYDFIIAKGISTQALKAKDVKTHYANGVGLYAKDYDLLMDIIKELYPELYPYALEYSNGSIFYPCNMFIMEKKLFSEYNEMLFSVMFEFEKRADIKNYSVQSYRAIGHLAERFLGMFYLFCQKEKKLRMHELQVALFLNTEPDVKPFDNDNGAVPIVFASDNNYVPVLSTAICSVIENISNDRRYALYVLHRNISKANQNIIRDSIQKDNVTIDFVNINGMVAKYNLKGRMHISAETYYRFLLLDILKNFKKAIYIDCDLVVCDDLAKLYDIDIGENLIAAVKDVDFNGQLNIPATKSLQYAKKTLRLDNPYDYFQAGVLVMNIQEFRKTMTVTELLDIASKDAYRYSDQDMLNVLCYGKVHFLDMEWNHIFDNEGTRIKKVASWAAAPVFESYLEARNNPHIIHFAGHVKPWDDAESEFGTVFWKYARMSPYYEVLIQRLVNTTINKKTKNKSIRNNQSNTSNKSIFTKATYVLLPENSAKRDKARQWYYKHFGVPEYDEFGNRKH